MNDLQDLSGESLFILDPNWATLPKYNLYPMRRILSYRGGDQIQSKGSVPYYSFNGTYLLYDRTRKNYFLNFMNDHSGRLNRFWVKHPQMSFTQKGDYGTGAVKINVERNQFDWIYQGYERLYIEMPNGDIITRKIDSVVENVGADRLELSFTPALDRNILTSQKAKIGRLLLMRMDHDQFSYKILTDEISEITTRFVELLYEYLEV